MCSSHIIGSIDLERQDSVFPEVVHESYGPRVLSPCDSIHVRFELKLRLIAVTDRIPVCRYQTMRNDSDFSYPERRYLMLNSSSVLHDSFLFEDDDFPTEKLSQLGTDHLLLLGADFMRDNLSNAVARVDTCCGAA